MKATPLQVVEVMTPAPHSIGSDQTIATARAAMRKYRVRHLPVLRAGKLVGVVSDRDLEFVLASDGADPERDIVEDAMTQEPYCVAPDARVDEVALEMAAKRYGSAVVMHAGHVVGIFTTVDGMRLLGETLSRASSPTKRSRARTMKQPARSRRPSGR